ARAMAERRERDREGDQPEQELRDVANGVVLEMREKLRPVRPFHRRYGDPSQARAIDEEKIADEDEAETEPDRPPILLAPKLAPTGARRAGRRAELSLCPAHFGNSFAPCPRGGATVRAGYLVMSR